MHPQVALAAGAGALTAGAFPPWNLWPLALVGLVPLGLICFRRGPVRAGAAGLAFGLGLGLVQMYWIIYVLTIYGGMPWLLAGVLLLGLQLYLALFTAAFAFLAGGLRRLGLPLLATGPLLWAGCEWLKGHTFSGFPWLPLGQALAPALPLVQSAEYWGSGGLSALVVLVNLLVARALLPSLEGGRPGRREVAALLAAVIILGGGWWWGLERLGQVRRAMARAPHLAVSVVQPNIALTRLWRKEWRLQNLARQGELTRRAAAGQKKRPWLVVWSESSAPFYFLNDARATKVVLDQARRLGAYLLVGSLGSARHQGRVKPTNRSWLVGPGGRPLAYYDKVHLVPFGEYVPYGDYLPFVKAMAAASGDFAPGTRGSTLDMGGVKLGPLICYESIFPDLARHQRLGGARLMVNQTNDSWFGPTGASRQHLSHLVLRAVETRLACARAAITGVSGFVEPDGRVVQTIGLFRTGVQTRSLPLMNMTTFYTRHGDLVGPWGLALCLAAGLVAAIAGRRRQKESKDV